MLRNFSKLAAVIAGMAVTAPAYALTVEPLVMQFDATGPGATRHYEVVNDSDKPCLVDLSVVHREMATNGHEKLAVALKDFHLSTPFLALQPGERKSVEVKWRGTRKPKTELAYRFIAQQRLVEADRAIKEIPHVKMNVIVRVQGAVYVVPPKATSRISVEGVKRQAQKGAAPQLAVVLKNGGNAHVTLQNPTLDVKTADGRLITLTADHLAGMTAQTVLAGHRRQFLVPLPANLPTGRLTATLVQG